MLSEKKEDSVSPVIGVILLVAIVIIIAVTIAVFLLGLGDNLKDTGTAAVNVENGGAQLINPGSSEKVIVKDKNGSIKGNLTEVGESVSVSGGDQIIAVGEDGSETLLKEVKDKNSSEGYNTVVVNNNFTSQELNNNSKFKNIKNAINSSSSSNLKVLIQRGNSRSGDPYSSNIVGKNYSFTSQKPIDISNSLILQGENNPQISTLRIYNYNNLKVRGLSITSAQLFDAKEKTELSNINTNVSGTVSLLSNSSYSNSFSGYPSNTRGSVEISNSKIKLIGGAGFNKINVENSKTKRQIYRESRDINIKQVTSIIDGSNTGTTGMLDGTIEYETDQSPSDGVVKDTSIKIADSKFKHNGEKSTNDILINDSSSSINIQNIDIVNSNDKIDNVGGAITVRYYDGTSSNVNINDIKGGLGLLVASDSVDNLDVNKMRSIGDDSGIQLSMPGASDVSISNSFFEYVEPDGVNTVNETILDARLENGNLQTSNVTGQNLKTDLTKSLNSDTSPIIEKININSGEYNLGGTNTQSVIKSENFNGTINGVPSDNISTWTTLQNIN